MFGLEATCHSLQYYFHLIVAIAESDVIVRFSEKCDRSIPEK